MLDARPQVLTAERVRMQPSPVNLHSQQLFQAYVAQTHVRSEVIEKRELTWLGRGLEADLLQAELPREPIGKHGIEVAALIEQANTLGALASFDDQLQCAGVA